MPQLGYYKLRANEPENYFKVKLESWSPNVRGICEVLMYDKIFPLISPLEWLAIHTDMSKLPGYHFQTTSLSLRISNCSACHLKMQVYDSIILLWRRGHATSTIIEIFQCYYF